MDGNERCGQAQTDNNSRRRGNRTVVIRVPGGNGSGVCRLFLLRPRPRLRLLVRAGSVVYAFRREPPFSER